MIGFDASSRAVAELAVKRDHDTRAMDPFRDFRGRDSDYSAMPVFAGNHGNVRTVGLVTRAFQLSDGAGYNLRLHLLTLLVSLLQMRRQSAGFGGVLRAEQLDDCQ